MGGVSVSGVWEEKSKQSRETIGQLACWIFAVVVLNACYCFPNAAQTGLLPTGGSPGFIFAKSQSVSLFAFGSFSSANISEAAKICCFMRDGMILICFVCLERNFSSKSWLKTSITRRTSYPWRTRIRLPFDTRGCSIQTVWDTSLYSLPVLFKKSNNLLQAP